MRSSRYPRTPSSLGGCDVGRCCLWAPRDHLLYETAKRKYELQSSFTCRMLGGEAGGAAQSCWHLCVTAVPNPGVAEAVLADLELSPTRLCLSTAAAGRDRNVEGWWEVFCGCGVGLRVEAESCEKSSERIQTEHRLHAGAEGGSAGGSCFPSCLLTSAARSGAAFGVSAPRRQC